MECPYCGTRNIPGALVCNHCGAILREVKRSRPAPKERGISGGFAGAARSLFGGGRTRAQLGALQGRIKTTLEEADARAQADVKSGKVGAQTRLNLGAAHLLQNEIERAVQEFQQAQKTGASGAEFINNAGVALARRGHLTQALDMFPRALQASPQSIPPHANAAHAHARLFTGANPDALTQALREAQQAATLDAKNATYSNRLGQIFCRQGQYAEAQPAFSRAEALTADDAAAQADALNNRGVAFALAGDLANAAAQFGAALGREPTHGRAQGNQAVLLMSQGDFEGALERLGRAARIDPHSALVRNNYGCILSRMLAINEGIREFKEAIGLDTHQMEPLYNQAKSYADEGLSDIAERYLARALQLAPRSWEALTVMGAVKLGLGQFPLAVQAFQAAHVIRPQDTKILTNLGLARAMSGDEDAAETAFQEASRLAPREPEINLHLGWLYLRQGQTSAAVAELAIALEQNDNLAVGHNNYGLCEVELANPTEAVRHFRRAVQLDPSLAGVHYQLGCAYALLNDMPAAIREWEVTAKEESGNADGCTNLGVAYYKASKMDQAVVEFRRVITLRQNRLDDYSNLGLAYAKQGMLLKAAAKKDDDPRVKEAQEKQKLAIEMFDRAIALQPNNVKLHSNRGLACYFANRPEAAMQEWGFVSRLDPGYARRRAAKQQSEFDESQVDFVPLNTRERALPLPAKTPDYLHQYAFSYDLDEWELILSDSALAAVPALQRQARQMERAANAQ